MNGSTSTDLATVRSRAAAFRPRAKPSGHRSLWAATALIVAPGRTGPDLAFIQRPSRSGDRWSGQMALPGGKRDDDEDTLATARRETYEEIGVDLPRPAGRLDDVRGRTHRGIVATYVFALDERPRLQPNPAEVAAALWIPLSAVLCSRAAGHHSWAGFSRFPAIHHEGYVIWGLTHRILASFARALGTELPRPA